MKFNSFCFDVFMRGRTTDFLLACFVAIEALFGLELVTSHADITNRIVGQPIVSLLLLLYFIDIMLQVLA